MSLPIQSSHWRCMQAGVWRRRCRWTVTAHKDTIPWRGNQMRRSSWSWHRWKHSMGGGGGGGSQGPASVSIVRKCPDHSEEDGSLGSFSCIYTMQSSAKSLSPDRMSSGRPLMKIKNVLDLTYSRRYAGGNCDLSGRRPIYNHLKKMVPAPLSEQCSSDPAKTELWQESLQRSRI